MKSWKKYSLVSVYLKPQGLPVVPVHIHGNKIENNRWIEQMLIGNILPHLLPTSTEQQQSWLVKYSSAPEMCMDDPFFGEIQQYPATIISTGHGLPNTTKTIPMRNWVHPIQL